MFKSSVKRNSVPPSVYPPTGIQVSREETPTKILTDVFSTKSIQIRAVESKGVPVGMFFSLIGPI